MDSEDWAFRFAGGPKAALREEHLATHVAIQHSSKKGKIEIEYYGDDDLQRLIELIGLPSGD